MPNCALYPHLEIFSVSSLLQNYFKCVNGLYVFQYFVTLDRFFLKERINTWCAFLFLLRMAEAGFCIKLDLNVVEL